MGRMKETGMEEQQRQKNEKCECAICKEPVVKTEENTCSECNRTFCENHNTVGSYWDGDSSKDEYLSTYCNTCAVDEISSKGDNC